VDPSPDLFGLESEGCTLILTPHRKLDEIGYHQIEPELKGILHRVEKNVSVRNLVLDLQQTPYLGSSALGFVLLLWKRISGRQGCLAIVNASDHTREILKVTKLELLWTIRATKEEALATMPE